MTKYPQFIAAEKAYQSKEYKKAIELFTACITINPKNADFYYHRALSYFHSDKKIDALNDLNKAQELEPKNPFRYSSRAYIKDSLGKTEAAIEDYQKATELDPEDAVAYNNLGLLQEKLGRKQRAEKNFAKADELSKKFFDGAPIEKEAIESKEERIIETKNIENTKKESKKSLLGEFLSVFKSKSTFKEFIVFIKNGFKLPE